MSLLVRSSPHLLRHLREHEEDGTTVAELLFEGGRLAYPGRRDVERWLGAADPYSLGHEARVLEGSDVPVAQIRLLAALASERSAGLDPTLDLLWRAHGSHRMPGEGPSLDRLVASLVAVRALHDASWRPGRDAHLWSALLDAAAGLIGWMHGSGLPPNERGLEELWDGAPPACIGLGLVEL